MTDSNDGFYSGDVNNADMLEAPRRQKASTVKAVMQLVTVVIGVLLLAIVLIRGSQPALTPEQIVQQQEYGGEQQARQIFNLYSLKQDRAEREVDRAGITAESEELRLVGAQREIPSSSSITKAETTSVNVYEKARLSRNIPVQVISTVPSEVIRLPVAIKPPQARSASRVLPVYTLKNNTAILRSSPSHEASPVLTIQGDQTVTLFEVKGNWAQVAANDGTGRSGYVLSTEIVAPAE